MLQPPPPPRLPFWQRRPFWLAVAAVTTVGYLVVGLLAAGQTYGELTREPTEAELSVASAAEVAARWRIWPAERIFPARMSYTSELGNVERARRIGIAPDTGCFAPVDAALVGILSRYRCRAVLRATYVDELQGIVMTFGVVAFSDATAAAGARRQLPGDRGRAVPGLRALGFPGTVTARFGDAARQHGAVRHAGPYIVLATAGQTDGRPAATVREQRDSIFLPAAEIAGRIATEMARPARPDCSKREWKC